ncbi:MAG: GTPase [Pseudomonadota bacterium]
MRLKSFQAKTMTEAMNMVREALGDDAVIVATREERGGASVRVTAAIDPKDYNESTLKAGADDDWLQYDSENDEHAIAEELTDTLLRHNTPEDVTDNIISCATVIGLENAGVALTAAIEHLFYFRPLPQARHDQPIMFVGPAGSGKTLAAAKLAARSTMAGLKVGVISCDTVRAGGIDQLRAFTDILQIDLHTAESAKGLHSVLSGLKGFDQIIIDTPACYPFDKDDLIMIEQFLQASNADAHFVMPTGIDAQEAAEIAKAFGHAGVHTLIPTRIDTAKRLGSILAAAHSGSMAFADGGHTSKVADGFTALTPQSLARLLMPSAYRDGVIQEHDPQIINPQHRRVAG